MEKHVLLLFLTLIISISCSKEEVIKPLNMTLAAEMSLLPATVWVAEKRGFFKEVGLNLSIKEFDSGRNALENMLKNKDIDMATVAQTPIVFNSFNNEDYTIIATMAHSIDDVKVLARKDHGINSANDLKGKKVGATLRSTGHYFLEGFLSSHGMSLKDIKLHDVNAAQLKDKLISGELDAITTWEPHIYNTKKIIDKSKLTQLLSPIPFRKDFFFTVARSYVKTNKEQISRFLKAVIKAEKYIQDNPASAQQITADKINADLNIVKSIWDAFIFDITLEQSILVALEDEAQWAIDIGYTNKKAPNYLNFIYVNSLKELNPEAVNIIH